MVELTEFFVQGTPVPQGSLRSSGRGVLFYSNDKELKPWRRSIATAARESYNGEFGIDLPVYVRAKFLFDQLKKPKPYKTSAPDLDKLVRALLDGITDSGIYCDDSRVVGIHTTKEYVATGEASGVFVQLSAADN